MLPLASADASAVAAPPPAPSWSTAPVPARPRRLPPPEAHATAHTPWAVPTLHTLGLFATMRATEAYLWPDPFAETRPRIWLEHYREAFTRPPLFSGRESAFEWDHDHWTINVVGHGLLGSELFYRPRRCGASPLASLAFAAGASAVWEYVFEANGVRPSAVDLTYTPLAGLVLGEARYLGWNAANQIGDRTLRAVVQGLLDPLGELERGLGSPC